MINDRIFMIYTPILGGTGFKRDHPGALRFELMIMKYTIVLPREAIEGLKVSKAR